MRISHLASAALTAAALGLGGCTGGSFGAYDTLPISQIYYDDTFSGSEVAYATRFNPIPVYGRGAPFEDRSNLDAVVALMNQSPVSSGLRFVPATAPNASGYSVVFSVGQPLADVNYCAGRPDFTAGSGAQITGTFCLAGRVRSQAWAGVASSDLTTPSARGTVNTLITAMFSGNRGRTGARGNVFE